MTPEEVRRKSSRKAKKIESLIDDIEKTINQTANALTRSILRGFLQKLKSENGRIVQTINSSTTTLFNQVFSTFSRNQQKKLTKQIVKDFDTIIGENENYYRDTVAVDDEKQKAIRKIINNRLGIDEKGNLIKNGYMSGLLDDSQIRAQIQQFIYKEVMKGVGYEDLRESVKAFIQGDEQKLGVFNRYYRAFSYDVYSQINRYVAWQYAEELGMEYFIYNGGTIETSREFCIERNGNVYSSKEADEWVKDPNLTAIPSKETYNWRLEAGGYNCRHSIDYISKEVAYVLRPELKDLETK